MATRNIFESNPNNYKICLKINLFICYYDLLINYVE